MCLCAPVIQANWWLTFEDDFIAGVKCSIHGDIVFNCNQSVTLQQWVSKNCYFACDIHPATQSAIGEQQWETDYLFKTSPTLMFQICKDLAPLCFKAAGGLNPFQRDEITRILLNSGHNNLF